VLAIALMVALIISISISSASNGSWDNSNWSKRKTVTVMNDGTNALTDYQLFMNVTYTSGMQQDFSDLRFTWYNATSETEVEIPYWISDYTAGSFAHAFVKVKRVPANAAAIVYMYYQNRTSAISASNGAAAMEFFDDFNSDFNTSKWALVSERTACSTSGGNLVSASGGCLIKASYSGMNYTIHSKAKSKAEQNGNLEFFWRYDGNDLGPTFSYSFGVDRWVANDTIYKNGDSGYHTYVLNKTILSPSKWDTWKIKVNGGNFEVLKNSVSHLLHSELPENEIKNNGVGIYNEFDKGDSGKIDWYAITKFANPEPTYSISPAESLPTTTTTSSTTTTTSSTTTTTIPSTTTTTISTTTTTTPSSTTTTIPSSTTTTIPGTTTTTTALPSNPSSPSPSGGSGGGSGGVYIPLKTEFLLINPPSLIPAELDISSQFEVTVSNTGNKRSAVKFSFEGAPAEWFSVSSQPAELLSGQSSTYKIDVSPDKGGEYNVTVFVEGEDEKKEISLKLVVESSETNKTTTTTAQPRTITTTTLPSGGITGAVLFAADNPAIVGGLALIAVLGGSIWWSLRKEKIPHTRKEDTKKADEQKTEGNKENENSTLQ